MLALMAVTSGSAFVAKLLRMPSRLDLAEA